MAERYAQSIGKSSYSILNLFTQAIYLMESTNESIKLINLTNVTISLNSTNNFTFMLESISSSTKVKTQPKHLRSIQSSKIENILTISFDLIQQQPLTPLIQEITIFKLFCGIDFEVTAIIKLSKLFDLESLLYFTEMETVLIKGDQVEKGFVTVKTQQEGSCLKHSVEINFIVSQCLEFTDQLVSTLIVGNGERKWPFVVQNFIVTYNNNMKQKIFDSSLQKCTVRNLSLPQDFSYPLIDELQLPQHQQKINLSHRIQQLQNYTSPSLSKTSQQQLFICHDMKGGYVEDTNTFHPFRSNTKTHEYRFNYLSQTKIFNYFSHYPITIPPKMWRTLCKRYNVLCLGTFIVQPNKFMMDEDLFMTEEFALKLVYIAKRAKFDGFLINIEIPVQKPGRLIAWLAFLTIEMNKAVPGSQIVWYDSVVLDGQIRYQNELNLLNHAFYSVSNGIFTNYWWNQQSLLKSLNQKTNGKSIYIGNDCFGRNTYGGGKYDIWNAVNKIQQVGKGELGIALFAPGFTYEDNGERLRQSFTENQTKMYHGNNIQVRSISKWKYTMNGGQGWRQQDEWAVTSNQLCKRQALIKITQFQGSQSILDIRFSCFVVGTGPNFADYYEITLQVYDYKNDIVYVEKSYPKTVATEKEELVEIRLEIDCEIISDTVCVRVLETGKDAQFWVGHYGSRFKGQTISLVTQDNRRNWINNVPIQAVKLNRNYTTFFNKGQGIKLYQQGQPMQQHYSCLSDYDIPPVFCLNNASNLQIECKDAYIGGTCLKYHNTTKVVLNSFCLGLKEQVEKRFIAIMVVKDTEVVEIVYGKNYIVKPKKQIQLKNHWKAYQFQLIFAKELTEFSIQANFSKNSGLIGRFSLFQQSFMNEKQKIQTSIKLRASNKPKYIAPYHFDAVVESNNYLAQAKCPERLLLQIGDFSGFIYLEKTKLKQKDEKCFKLFGLLKQIPVLQSKAQEFDIQLINVDSEIFQIVLKKTISKSDLNSLIQNKEMSFGFDL